MSNKTILVIAPHPDDDIIGCGGSIIKHLMQGNEMFVIYVTNGDAECQQFTTEEFAEVRKKETFKAAAHLGLNTANLFFLEKKVWQINENKLRFNLLKDIRLIKPDICYIPSPDDHADHRIVNRAALDAINWAPGRWFRSYGSPQQSYNPPFVLAYEVLTSPLQSPGYFEDISTEMEKKIAALLKHKSQNLIKYEQSTTGLNAWRGAMIGAKFAEAFQIMKAPYLFYYSKNN